MNYIMKPRGLTVTNTDTTTIYTTPNGSTIPTQYYDGYYNGSETVPSEKSIQENKIKLTKEIQDLRAVKQALYQQVEELRTTIEEMKKEVSKLVEYTTSYESRDI